MAHFFAEIPQFDVSQVLSSYLWWYPVCACHQRTLGSHELTFLGDLISVTFDTNGHQIFQISKFPETWLLISPLTVLYSYLVTGNGAIGGSLGGPVTGLQRQVGDLSLKS